MHWKALVEGPSGIAAGLLKSFPWPQYRPCFHLRRCLRDATAQHSPSLAIAYLHTKTRNGIITSPPSSKIAMPYQSLTGTWQPFIPIRPMEHLKSRLKTSKPSAFTICWEKSCLKRQQAATPTSTISVPRRREFISSESKRVKEL